MGEAAAAGEAEAVGAGRKGAWGASWGWPRGDTESGETDLESMIKLFSSLTQTSKTRHRPWQHEGSHCHAASHGFAERLTPSVFSTRLAASN